MERMNTAKRENLKSFGLNPMKGLLQFYYYGVSGTIAIVMILCLVMAVAAIITGNFFIYNSAILLAVSALPYIIIVSMCNKGYLKWERWCSLFRGGLQGVCMRKKIFDSPELVYHGKIVR